MITPTAAIATTPKATNAAMFGAGDERRPMAPGARLTMPAKMMKLMPLPMPRSVMSSPIHIRAIGAGGQGGDLGQRLEAREVERRRSGRRCELSRARKP